MIDFDTIRGGRRSRYAGAAYVTAGVLLLLALVSCSILLILPAVYQPYLLPILLLLLAVVVATVKVWERPALGVVGILLLIAVPWGTGGGEDQGISVTLPDLAAAAFVGLMALRTLAVGDQGRLYSWVVLPLAGVVIAGGIATLTASSPTASLSGMVRYVELFVVVPVATYLALQSRRDLGLIMVTVVALAAFEGALGVYQAFTGTGAAYGDGESGVRAVGTFGAYNILDLANLVSYAVVVSVAAFMTLRGGRRLWILLLVTALLLPLALSLSRGAWIAAVAGVIAILALTNWKRLVLLALVGGLLLGATSGIAAGNPGVLSQRITSIYSVSSSPDQSLQDRYAMWEAARGMWADRPLTGVGLKNFPYFRDSYAPLSFSGGSDILDPGGYRRVELLSPHSLYWLILAEQGLAGALAYGTLFLSLGVAGLRRLRGMQGTLTEKSFGLSCVGFLVVYLTHGIYGDLGGHTTLLNSVLLGGLVWLASGTEPVEEIPA